MKEGFQVIAHRGASSLAPENTKSAFLKALEMGADCIETDLRLTKDGVWVVIHDGTLSRHGGKNRKVENLSLAELRQYEYGSWFSEEFRGEPILTLDEACDLVLPQAALILDMKTEGHAESLATCLGALSSRARDRIIISSFSFLLLKALAKINSRFRLGYLFKNGAGWRTWLAGRNRFYSVHPHRRVFTPDLAAQAHERGMKVFVWTVNQPQEMRELLRGGADGVFTDFPQRAAKFPERLMPQV